jgi:arabinose-5-phosphate isomerase
MIKEEDVIVAISNSGETEELIRLLSYFNSNKNRVIAMTSNEKSTLATFSNFFLSIKVSREACSLKLAPTSSTTVTLALGDALAVSLMKARGFAEEHFAKFHPGGSLGRRLLYTVADVMKTDELPILKADSNFNSILETISTGRLGLGVVIDNSKHILGVITDGDIRRILESKKEKALSLLAKDFMSKTPITIKSSQKIAAAEEIMTKNKINSIIVTKDKIIEGIIHRLDI